MKDTGKLHFKVPTEAFQFMYPRKHHVVRLHQQRINKYFGDRRRINHVMIHTNRHGETFLFGRYGCRKDETIITIGQFIANGFLRMMA